MQEDAVSSAEEQDKWLADAMALVQHNAFYMHRAVVSPPDPLHSIPLLNSHTGSLECTHSIPRSFDWDDDYHLHGFLMGIVPLFFCRNSSALR